MVPNLETRTNQVLLLVGGAKELGNWCVLLRVGGGRRERGGPCFELECSQPSGGGFELALARVWGATECSNSTRRDPRKGLRLQFCEGGSWVALTSLPASKGASIEAKLVLATPPRCCRLPWSLGAVELPLMALGSVTSSAFVPRRLARRHSQRSSSPFVRGVTPDRRGEEEDARRRQQRRVVTSFTVLASSITVNSAALTHVREEDALGDGALGEAGAAAAAALDEMPLAPDTHFTWEEGENRRLQVRHASRFRLCISRARGWVNRRERCRRCSRVCGARVWEQVAPGGSTLVVCDWGDTRSHLANWEETVRCEFVVPSKVSLPA